MFFSRLLLEEMVIPSFFMLLLASCSVIAKDLEITNRGLCFSGEMAEEMLECYINKRMQENAPKCIAPVRPKDCGEIDKKKGSGVYKIYPNGSTKGFDVYCNMHKDGGGWTVFQRRLDGKTDFFRNWSDYENGFGDLEKEFWLGNEKLHILTSQGNYELRVDLEDFENNTRYAKYQNFVVGDTSSKYKLTVEGYRGDAGDSLAYQNGYPFTTKDRDNDSDGSNCAEVYKGAWWYNGCHFSNLNGAYLTGNHKSFADGIEWRTWRGYNYSLKTTSMMIRQIKV